MAESRLQRWSRMKTGASQEAESARPSTAETELSAEEQELAINEALPEQGVLEKYDLPDPDAIELGTDITGFMRKEIPELLRRKALRALWRSNPVLAVLDGLNDYDEDFSNAATAVNGVQTLYKVGQGMFDKSARANEAVNEQSSEQVGNQIPGQAEAEKITEPERVADRASEEATEESAGTSALGISVEPSHNEYVESVTSGAEEEPATRYRPRMRFE